MISRNDKKLVRNFDKLNEKDTLPVRADLSSNRISKQSDNIFQDDLIAVLSAKRENQRARQVFEWETVRRRNSLRAA